MVGTMECPHCGEEILSSAAKCKHCFADLAPEDSRGQRRTIIGLLLFLVALVAIGIGGLKIATGTPSLANVTIDEGTDSIILVWTQYDEKPATLRIPFGDVAKVEYLAGSHLLGGHFWSVSVVTKAGETYEINHSTEKNLKGYAETVATKTGAPFVPINKVRAGRGLFGPGT